MDEAGAVEQNVDGSDLYGATSDVFGVADIQPADANARPLRSQ
jgi:hypothetical protein